MSACLALSSDIAMALLGARLKRRERLSARLGDVLSHLYLASAALKRFRDQGQPQADRPLLHWACRDALYQMQTAFDELFRNLPGRWTGTCLRLLVFPLGMPYDAPNDANDRRVARLLLTPSEARDRLTEGVFIGGPEDPVGRVEYALKKATAADAATSPKLRSRRRFNRASSANTRRICFVKRSAHAMRPLRSTNSRRTILMQWRYSNPTATPRRHPETDNRAAVPANPRRR
jgi:acyl-CoA dehydrogenase